MLLPAELERRGDTLKTEGESYKVRRRRGAPGKPALFLVRFSPSFAYISSLFPLEGRAGVFSLDYKGESYTLTLEATCARICLLSPASSGAGAGVRAMAQNSA